VATYLLLLALVVGLTGKNSINANAWKVSFWMLAYMLHHPELLAAIRAEVADATSAASPTACADQLSTTCPLLVALYHEILRLVTSSVSVRNVATDVTVGGKLLRKGGRIIIPYRQMLFNRDVFGADAGEFNVERFLANKSLASNPSFRPYGGGTTYCPGRFLAKTEVLSAVAVAAARFDMELVTEGYQGRGVGFPLLEMKKPCLGIMGPVDGDDVVVRVRIRAPEKSGARHQPPPYL
jgi:cytochrome P450